MMLIVAGLIKNIRDSQQAGRKPNCQSEKVDKRKHLIPGKASKCDLKVVFYHRRSFIKSRTNCFLLRSARSRNDALHGTSKIYSSNLQLPTSNILLLASLRPH